MEKNEQKHFDSIVFKRDKKGLGIGQRWLTCDDTWQDGDEYDGGQGWWKIGGSHTSIPAGTPIDIGMLCYTPRGKR